jgi:hypothetical protein
MDNTGPLAADSDFFMKRAEADAMTFGNRKYR